MQIFFIDFHQGPPRTVWQGPPRPLHKWPLLEYAPDSDNNNNNNTDDDIYGAVIMAQSHCESSPGSPDERRLSARWPPTLRPSQATCAVSLPVGCYHPHPPSPFVTITQPKLILIYRPAEGRRPSRPRHCSKVAQPVPKAAIAAAVAINATVRGEIRTWVLSQRSRTR